MAEIHVQPRKKGGHGWVWLLLLLLVVAAVVWFLYSNGSLNFAAAVPEARTLAASTLHALTALHSGGLNGTA